MSITPLTVPPKKLAQTISATQLTFKMSDIEGWNGNDLTPADFGTEAYGVFINSTRTQIEIFSFDPATIADAEITINARGLGYSGQVVSDPTRQYPWASNDTTIQLGTDAPQLFRDYMSQSNTQTITALHTYDVLPQSAETPTDDEDFTTKLYVDGLTEPAITVPVNQVAHGLSVGEVIRISGANIYVQAQANGPTNAEVVGIVTEVTDADNFKYTTEGVVEAGVPAFPAGTVVFLSRTTPGALVDTDTATIGEVSLPLGQVVENGTRMIFHKYRGATINSISGNPIASETEAGMVEQATPTQVANRTDVGETGAPLFVVPSLLPTASEEYLYIQETPFILTTDNVITTFFDYTIAGNTFLDTNRYFEYRADPTRFRSGGATATFRVYINEVQQFTFIVSLNSSTSAYYPVIRLHMKRTGVNEQVVLATATNGRDTGDPSGIGSAIVTEDETQPIRVRMAMSATFNTDVRIDFATAKLLTVN